MKTRGMSFKASNSGHTFQGKRIHLFVIYIKNIQIVDFGTNLHWIDLGLTLSSIEACKILL